MTRRILGYGFGIEELKKGHATYPGLPFEASHKATDLDMHVNRSPSDRVEGLEILHARKPASSSLEKHRTIMDTDSGEGFKRGGA